MFVERHVVRGSRSMLPFFSLPIIVSRAFPNDVQALRYAVCRWKLPGKRSDACKRSKASREWTLFGGVRSIGQEE